MSFRDTRGEIVHRRTYSRPLDEEKGIFETLEQTTDRIIEHQAFMLVLDCDRDARGAYFEKVYLPVRLRNRVSSQTTDVHLEVE